MWKFYETMIGRLADLLRGRPAGDIPLSVIARYLPNNPVILEAGAHRGGDTVRMARRWPGATIHSFEPVPDLFEVLTRATTRFPQVRRYPVALSDRAGQAPFHISAGASDGSSSLLSPTGHLTAHPDVVFPRDLTVTTVTVDEWAREHGISKVDFLWLDLQGGELRALQGGQTLLRTVGAIHAEVSLYPLYEECVLYPVLRDWLEKQGFRVAVEELPWPEGGNVLFVRHPPARVVGDLPHE